MPLNVLFAGRPDRWEDYAQALRARFKTAGLDVVLSNDMEPGKVDYIIYAPNGPVQDFTPYTQLKAVFNLWAGVERVVKNPSLTVPLTRMVDAGLELGMREWVTGHVLRHHLGMDTHIVNPEHAWSPRVPPLAQDRPVTILGLGTLGQACAKALLGLGFPVAGWSRTPKQVEGVHCLSGEDGLRASLETAQILVLLLPFTPETENVLNATTLALLPRGAFVINPGRGPLIDDAALIKALDSGQVAHATLDVFREEPLPQEHAYWSHPSVTVTPHIAAETRTGTSADVVVENLRRHQAGEDLLYLVDRAAGY